MIRNENNRRFKMEIEKLQAIIHFSATEQQIYKLVFEESMTTRTAGKIAGISPASAWKMKKKITEKLDQIEKKYTKRV
jgi:DNA-directed RNA polymerase specialized sigma subunit